MGDQFASCGLLWKYVASQLAQPSKWRCLICLQTQHCSVVKNKRHVSCALVVPLLTSQQPISRLVPSACTGTRMGQNRHRQPTDGNNRLQCMLMCCHGISAAHTSDAFLCLPAHSPIPQHPPPLLGAGVSCTRLNSSAPFLTAQSWGVSCTQPYYSAPSPASVLFVLNVTQLLSALLFYLVLVYPAPP
jgi:hypothetical protein